MNHVWKENNNVTTTNLHNCSTTKTNKNNNKNKNNGFETA